MTAHTFSVVTVTVERRLDSGLRAYSDDLPGLILSGADRGAVLNAIAPAIRALFEHRGLKGIAVHPARPVADVLSSPNGVSPLSNGDAEQTQFVVELPVG